MTKEISRENKLLSATYRSHADEALRSLTRSLGIGEDTDALAADHFPTQRDWVRLDTTGKLFAIAQWLNAECAAIADLSSRTFVLADDPLDTVGTRD